MMIRMDELINVFSSSDPSNVTTSVKLLLLLTILSIAPGILILATSFIRIIVVLSFVRTSLATQQMPPNQVLIGLALFLTFFVMAPTFSEVYSEALDPLFEEEITLDEAYQNASVPMKDFMSKHTREKDLALFFNYTEQEPVESVQDIPLTTLIPAFAISELKTAFQMGFMIFIPFLIIDKIGRASCRESVYNTVMMVSLNRQQIEV